MSKEPNLRATGVMGYVSVEPDKKPESLYDGILEKFKEKQSHYKRNNVEVRDVLNLIFKFFQDDLTSMEASCIFNIIKYVMRCKYKGDHAADIEKAKTYLDWLDEEITKEKESE